MSIPEFPLKPPKLSETLKKANPMKEVGSVLREGIQSIQGAIDDIDSSMREIDGGTRSQPKAEETPASITDEETLRYEIDLVIEDVQHLETEHLPNQGRIAGKPCDCIAKAARDLRRHARETIPIAARQGKDPVFYRELASWADRLVEIGTLDAVASGEHDAEYLELAGAASQLRKEAERRRQEVRPKGFRETCQECGTLEDLKDWGKRKAAERPKA